MSHETDDVVFKNYKRVWDLKLSHIKDVLPIDVLFLYSDNNLL